MTNAPWQDKILARGELYRVGGAVRDELMGIGPTSEIDYLVREIEPEEFERLLEGEGRLTLVGKSFGVYKFRPHGSAREIDIAYPRREVSTGPGHREFDVVWDWKLPIEEDLGRRDFTINAIARNVRDGRLVDPFDGARDIKKRILRMIFPRAFEEDPLRILRGIRFAARFALRIEPATFDAMKAAVRHMGTLSAERVQGELTKLLEQCEAPSKAFELMHDTGVLGEVLPDLERAYGVEQNEYHPDDVFHHSLKTCDETPPDNLSVRWAGLLHDLGKVAAKKTVEVDGSRRVVFYGHENTSADIARRVLRELRYSNDFIDHCSNLVQHHMFNYHPEWNRATVRRFIRRVGQGSLEDLFLLREADCRSRDLAGEVALLEELRKRVALELREARALKVEDLAVDGNDIQRELELAAGPEIGRVLGALLEVVLEDPALNTRRDLLRIAREKFGV